MAVLLSEKKPVVSRAWPMCSGPLAAEKKLKRCLERPREPLDVCGTLLAKITQSDVLKT